MSRLLLPFEWLRAGGRRRLVWLGVPILLYAWSVAGPFAFDDLHLLLKAERYLRGESNRPDLFRFAASPEEWQTLRDRGAVPWWFPATQRVDFLRPLAEWSFTLDVMLFGRGVVGHRLVSLCWFALALLGVNHLFRTAGAAPARAGAATLLVGCSQTLAQPVTFICNRSDLLVIVGVSVAAAAYWRMLQPQASGSGEGGAWRSRLGILAVAAYAMALASKEMALGLCVVVLLHEAVRHWRRRPVAGGRGPLLLAAGLALTAAAYAAYYIASRAWLLGADDGAAEAGISRVAVFARAPTALPLYLSVWTVGFPINVLPWAGPGAVAGVIIASLLLVACLLRPVARLVRADPAAGFFLLWAVVFMGIGLFTVAEVRVLSVATVGWAYLVSGLLLPSPDARPVSLWLRHWLLTAGTTVSLCCAVTMVALQNHFEREAQSAMNDYLRGLPAPLADGDTLVVAEPRSGLELLWAGDRLAFLSGQRGAALVFLTAPGAAAEFERLDDRTLIASTASGDLLGTAMYDRPLGLERLRRVGSRFEHRDFTAEILAADGVDSVRSIAFRFKQPVASPSLRFFPPDLVDPARDREKAESR